MNSAIIEGFSRAIDPEAWADGETTTAHAVLSMHRRRQAANAAAQRVANVAGEQVIVIIDALQARIDEHAEDGVSPNDETRAYLNGLVDAISIVRRETGLEDVVVPLDVATPFFGI